MGKRDDDRMLKPGDPLYERIAQIKARCDGYLPEHVEAYTAPGVASHVEKLTEFARTYCGMDAAEWTQFQMDQAWQHASPEAKAAARTAAETIIEGTYTFISETDA